MSSLHEQDQHCDWIAVIGFYAAVHLVEAGFVHNGKPNSKKHRHRNDRLIKDYPQVWAEFKPLWNLSKVARYEANSVISAKTINKVVNNRLPKLKEAITKYMGLEITEVPKIHVKADAALAAPPPTAV